MGIISELKGRNIDVMKTDHLYRGFYSTSEGNVITMNKFKCDDGIYFLENAKGVTFPCNDRIIYITSGTEYEGNVKSKEEAEQLAKEGKILSFKSSDLYAEFYDFENNKELECCFKYGYSSRSRKYIESVMSDIGLLNYTYATNGSMSEDGEPTKFDVIHRYDIFVNAETEVGRLETGLWIVQTIYVVDIDDFAVIKMYFNHEPSVSDFELAFAIKKFEQKPIEVFRCWECGHLVNWLDLDGDIKNKYDMAEDKYCGC